LLTLFPCQRHNRRSRAPDSRRLRSNKGLFSYLYFLWPSQETKFLRVLFGEASRASVNRASSFPRTWSSFSKPLTNGLTSKRPTQPLTSPSLREKRIPQRRNPVRPARDGEQLFMRGLLITITRLRNHEFHGNTLPDRSIANPQIKNVATDGCLGCGLDCNITERIDAFA